MMVQPTVENATAGLEPDCRNWTTGNCSAPDPRPLGAGMVANLSLYGLICAAGIVGNGLVIYVVLRSVWLSLSLSLSVCLAVISSLIAVIVSQLPTLYRHYVFSP